MVYSPRIGPDGAFVREISEIRDRIKSIETAPAGNIVIREQLITEDPVTGVKTIVGQLPDGSYGVQPFIGDVTPPPVATTPIATAQPGFITVTWDGLFVNNEEKPRDFEHVNVIGHKLVNGSILSSVEVGVLRLPSDTVLVTQDIAAIGETWQFSLESEDYNGNKASLSSKTASVTMLSAVTDEGVNDALDQINQDVISSQSAAASAQNAADTAQKAADDAKKAVVDLGSITGTIYTQSATPSANSNSLWIDTGHNNVPRRYLGKVNRRALVANLGGGASVAGRLSSLGYAVSAITVTPTFDQASAYDVVAFDAGYAGLSSGINTLAVQLLDRGVSVFTSGNDTTAFPYLWTGYGNRGATKNPIRPSGTHPAAQGWAQYSDNDLNYYFTGIDPNATVTGVTLVGTVDQAVNVVREHPTTFARWAHVQTYATPVDTLNAHLNWVADNWVVVQDQGIISASSAAASAQNKADQAFNNAASAAQAAGQAQSTADGKNSSYYLPSAPAGSGFKVGDQWFDTSNNYALKVWNGSAWITAQDAALAKQIADSKALVYTQSTTPPLEARVASTIWYDTSLGLDKVVQKYWNGSAWTAVADKTATDARTVADAKGETIYSSTEPDASKRLPQNLWVDTTGGININKRWDGSAWVVVADSRIASTATAVTAAQATADSKALVYTQSVTPPVEARVASTIWNDTSLGLNNVVVKYWNGSAWTPLADKVATDAANLAAAKTKTYFQTTQPSNTGNTTGDLWFDTANGNKVYVWNGSAWTVAQDTTIDKSLFNSFSTDMDSTQPNKWVFTKYNKTMPGNTYVPSYLDIAGITGTSSIVADGANLVNTVGDNYVGQLRTIVNTVSATTIAITATHDDAARIYVDGVSVYSKAAYTQNSAISFNLSAGWHVIDLLWTEISGGDGWFNISPTFASQVTSMYAPVSLSSVSQAVSAAQKSADTAMASQSYSLNPSFDDWTGTFPAGYSNWSSTPVKETAIIRRAPNAVRFNVPDTTTQAGIQFTSPLAHAPNLEYFTVELEFYLVSGTLGQAGVILDWNGMTGGRALVNLADEITSPVTGKWYRVSKTLRRPTSATGTWTGMGGYLMGQWTGHTGGGAAKNIIFDWINVRPSSSEEILAYNAPADAQTKATAAQNAAISAAATDATNKANTAQTNAINAAQAKIDQVWATSRSYVNPATNTTGIVAKQGVIPTVVASASAMGGYALQKTGSVNAWLEDWNAKQAYDPTALYRFTARVRIISSSSASGSGFYWGLVGLAADGTTYVNTTGANSYSSQQWVTQNTRPPATGEWVDYTVYYSGISTGNPSGAGTSPLAPRSVQANTRFFVPGMILDYPNGNGVWEVSHWSVDVIDASGYQAIVDAQNAKTDAINTAAADATSKANAAQAAAISAAAADATSKANTAQQAAIDAAALDAQAKADQAEADAKAAAAVDAQAKADAAEQAAIDAAAVTAQLKADGAEQAAIDAAAADATQKAATAQQAAIDAAAADATAKAAQAKADAISAAATDAQTRATEAKTQAIEAAATDATTKADAAQAIAIQSGAYSLNPSFENWTGTYPDNYGAFNTAPTKETTTVRTGKTAARFNCTDTTTQRGLTVHAALAHAPYFEYMAVELDVRLDSGTSFGGAGVLVDWNGMTGANRVTLSLATEIPTPVTGRWYRVVKVIRKPATATGTFTSFNAWLMGQYSSGMGTMAVKNVIFDWINIRPATTEEITAYGTPASIQSLSDTVNTKTKSWFQPGQPPLTGNTAGDLWFDTDDNNKVYIWNGAWSVASDQRIESLNTAVSAAQTSANGKNKVIYSTSAASGTNYTAGDTWFQRDANNNVVAMWEFTTSWQSRQLSHQVQASIDAAKISVGTLDVANRIAANAITAGKLTVSDMEEFIPNPFFHPAGEPVTQGTIVTTANTPVSAGAPYPNAVLINTRDNHPFNFPNIPVKPGDQFYLEVWVASASTAIRNFNLYMFGSTTPNGGLSAKVSTGNVVPGTTWRKVTWNFAVPATNPGYQYIRPVLQINNSGGETAAQMEWYATGFSMKRKNTGELIVDGAIKAGSAIIDNLAVSNAQIADLAINTAKIQNAAVKTAQIDDLAVTDGKIVSLNAGKITAGYLDARVIAAGSIKADKLDVTLGGNNLLSNSSFEVDSNSDGLADGWNTWARGAGDASRTFANTRPAGLFPGSTYAQRVTSNNVSNTEASSIQSSQLFSIAPGASATISLYGRASVAGTFTASLRCEDDTGAYKGDAGYNMFWTTATQLFEGTVVIPAGTTRAKMTLTTSGSLTSGHWFEVDGIKVELGDVASAWSPMTSELLPGTIVGTMLSATAIDGKIITGATIQTELTANRGIKLTSTELAGYDTAGIKNFSLTSSGSLTLKGAITSGSTISGATVTGSTVQTEATVDRGIKLTTTELAGYDTSGNKNFSLLTDGTLSVKGSIESGSIIKGATLAAGTGGIKTNSTANRGVELKDSGIRAYDSNGNLTFILDSATGVVELPGLKANSISSTSLAATAIDGMTITGATVQTEKTASRGIKLTSTELAGYNGSGVKNFSLTSAGALTLIGAIQSGSTITGTQVTGSTGIQTSTSATAGVKINNQGIVAYDGSNSMTFKLDATTGYLELPGIRANSINGDRLVAGSVTTDRLVVGDMTNYVIDPYMSGSGKISGVTYVTASATSVSSGAPYEKLIQANVRDIVENPGQMRPVSGGEIFYAEAWVRADATAAKNIYLGIWSQSEDGTNSWNTSSTMSPSTSSWSTPAAAQAGWVKLTGTFVVPATVAAGKPTTKARAWIQIGGTTGVDTQGWFITGWEMRRQADVTTIADGVITTNKIIASGIDAGVLKAGTLAAARIGSKSITTDKLVVSSTDNLIVEADFGNNGSSWNIGGNKTIVATAGRGNLPALRVTGTTALQTVNNLSNRVTVGSEDRFRGSFYVKSSVAAASGVAKLGMKAYTTATTSTNVIVATSPAVSANTWTLAEGYSPALPANTIAVEFYLEVQNAATGTTLDIDYVAMTRAADGKLVVDGAIDGKTITGAIIRTAATSNRVQLDSTGLRAFDSLGNETVSISGLDGTISATGQLSAYGISKDFFTNNDVTIRAILGNKIARNSWVGYDYLQPGVYFERQDGVAQSMLEIPQLISARTTDIGMRSAHLIDDPTNKPNNRQYSSVGAGPYSAGLGSSLYDKSINEDGGNGLNGILQHSGVVAEYDYAQMYVEDGMDIGYWGSASIAVGGRNKVDDGRGTGVGGQISGAEMRIESGYSDPDPSTALVRIDRLGQLDINTTHANKAVRISSNDDGVLAVSATNGVSFKNQVDAPKYLVNGKDLSTGEVHVISSSGTIGNAAVPVPRLQNFSTVAGDSTSTSLATLNTGSITVANTGVYDITWSYGGGGVVTDYRSFIEIKIDNQAVPVPIARSIFDNGEDSVTTVATGVRITAGTPIYFEVYQNSGGSRSYNSRISLKRVAGPQPTAGWGSGNIVQEGNVTVNGNLYAKHRRAEFNNGGFDVAANAVWDIGPQTLNTAAPGTLNNDFCQPGPYAGSIGFTKSGYYSFTAFVQPNGSPGGTWLRGVRGSDGRYLGQTSNGAAWENTLTLTSFYFAAGDYVRFQYSASVAHNIRSWVTVTQAY